MAIPPEQFDQLRQILIDRLESLRRAGVMQLPRAMGITPPAVAEPARAVAAAELVTAGMATVAEAEPTLPHAVPPPIPTPPPAVVQSQSPRAGTESEFMTTTRKSTQSRSAKKTTLYEAEPATGESEFSHVPSLEVLQPIVAGCTRCGELASTRTQTVFGVGNPKARLCFLGEAPGADEDRLGEPFVGRAGQLLTKIIEACKMSREDVYILNMLKCRPPGNRNPLPTELEHCRGYLDRQLELIQPEFICCCGAVASQNLLQTTVSIGKLRGKLHEYRGIKVVCTYHPAFLLRSPSFKKETWEDMKFLMREMGWKWED